MQRRDYSRYTDCAVSELRAGQPDYPGCPDAQSGCIEAPCAVDQRTDPLRHPTLAAARLAATLIAATVAVLLSLLTRCHIDQDRTRGPIVLPPLDFPAVLTLTSARHRPRRRRPRLAPRQEPPAPGNSRPPCLSTRPTMIPASLSTFRCCGTVAWARCRSSTISLQIQVRRCISNRTILRRAGWPSARKTSTSRSSESCNRIVFICS